MAAITGIGIARKAVVIDWKPAIIAAKPAPSMRAVSVRSSPVVNVPPSPARTAQRTDSSAPTSSSAAFSCSSAAGLRALRTSGRLILTMAM